MSLLVRAAVLGGLAYVVSRAVRKSQHSLESSRAETERLARATDDDDLYEVQPEDQTSTSKI